MQSNPIACSFFQSPTDILQFSLTTIGACHQQLDLAMRGVETRGFEQCLFVYPLDEWAKVEAKLRELNNYNPEHRKFLRAVLAMANEVQLDSQARLSVPPDLRDYAKIRGEVMVIGTLDKIELWDPALYQKYVASLTESYEEIAEKVMK